jgi:hypothetical protein
MLLQLNWEETMVVPCMTTGMKIKEGIYKHFCSIKIFFCTEFQTLTPSGTALKWCDWLMVRTASYTPSAFFSSEIQHPF